MAKDFTASPLYPDYGETIAFTPSEFPSTGVTYSWSFRKVDESFVYPTYLFGTTSNSRNPLLKFEIYGTITCILTASWNNGDSTEQIRKDNYITIVGTYPNYVYSLISTSLDSLTLTTTGYKDVTVKVTQLNALTLLEDTLSPIEGTQVNGYVTLTGESEDYSIIFAEDGVYFIYCQYGSITTRHIFVNIKTILEYIDATVLENICCSSNSVVNYPNFSQKDYIFNVISNLVHSFLGIELSDIEFNYGELTDYSTLYADKIYECISVGGTTPNWTLDNITCVETVSGVALNSNSHMIEGNTYRCLSTGVPSSFGGDVISAYTTTLDTQLKDMSEIIYKVNQYLIGNDNISC